MITILKGQIAFNRSIVCRVVLETFNDDLAGPFCDGMIWDKIIESLEMLSAQTINVLNVFIRQLLGDISVYK